MESGKNAIVTAMTVMMRAEIVYFDDRLITGRLFSQYLEAPYVFTDLLRMIEKMEEIFDSKGFPQMFLKPRTFGGAGAPRKKISVSVKNCAMKDNKEFDNTEGQNTSKCTFEIAVRFRQNATWQGQIFWTERNLKQNFRSVLEMLRLMDEALIEEADNKNMVGWENRSAGG